MKPIRIIVLGFGRWGQRWIQNLKADPNYEIVGIVCRHSSNIESVCQQNNIIEQLCFTSIEEALEQVNPNAALLVVPPEKHFPIAMQCMEAGLHILSEKPLAVSMKEAFALFQAARRYNRHFMVSQDYRWQPSIQTLRNLISSRTIGEICYIIYCHFQALHRGGWREQMGQVLLEDMAIHHFDILRYITGKDCVEVYVDSYNPKWSWYRGGAAVSAILSFENGFRASYFGTWVTTGREGSWPGELRIDGEYGSLSLTADSKVLLFKDGHEQEIPQDAMALFGRDYALHLFKKTVSEGIIPETDIEDNIKSFAIVQAALESNRLHKPINLAEVLQPL